jgi:hypothetical protein
MNPINPKYPTSMFSYLWSRMFKYLILTFCIILFYTNCSFKSNQNCITDRTNRQAKRSIKHAIDSAITHDEDISGPNKHWKIVHYECYKNDLYGKELLEVKVQTKYSEFTYYYFDQELNILHRIVELSPVY